MAEAMKCDRCGKFYVFYGKNITVDRWKYKVNGFRYTFNRAGTGEGMDLCPDCLQKLYEFMNEKEKMNGKNPSTIG